MLASTVTAPQLQDPCMMVNMVFLVEVEVEVEVVELVESNSSSLVTSQTSCV